MFNLDPTIRRVLTTPSPISQDIWAKKYRWNAEGSLAETCARVCRGVYELDSDQFAHDEALAAMLSYGWMPAGRIFTGAGTTKRVTLNNCYVTGTIDDSMEGIMREHTNFALTMQQGGGDGADFSTIRPENAILRRTGSAASGPLPFMRMWNGMCETIRSAGDRRGAMMATLCDTHPDLLKFVTAKQKQGELTNFNLSILVSDAFMGAIAEDAEWLLYFHVEPVIGRSKELKQYDFVDENGVQQYVYSVHRARALWETITRSTYEYSEPGIIFIDRINQMNNLSYCETIRCTNPCGEQPLPPHGACDLGHIFLPACVREPFTSAAYIDWDMLRRLVRIGVRFLDNVIDVTRYPLPEQEAEQKSKRRIGLGYTGLADVFMMLQMSYGGFDSVELTDRIGREIMLEAYRASIELAKERGPFPLFDPVKYIDENNDAFVIKRLPPEVRRDIREYGIRNGVILTIAPTGTTSIVYGNVCGGLEPAFALEQIRNVRKADDTFEKYTDYCFAVKVWKELFGEKAYPAYFNTMADLTVQDHFAIQGAAQRWIDASVSKTINLPEDYSYEQFVQVYQMAYKAGCKGCTTYRPSEVRGSILQDATKKPTEIDSAVLSGTARGETPKRPAVLTGKTYQIKWGTRKAALYITINSDESGTPFEVLITSKDISDIEWTTALSLMISAIFKRGGDISFVARELQQIESLNGSWVNQQFVSSLPARIGQIIESHVAEAEGRASSVSNTPTAVSASVAKTSKGSVCPECKHASLIKDEGCIKCTNCGYSKCG